MAELLFIDSVQKCLIHPYILLAILKHLRGELCPICVLTKVTLMTLKAVAPGLKAMRAKGFTGYLFLVEIQLSQVRPYEPREN